MCSGEMRGISRPLARSCCHSYLRAMAIAAITRLRLRTLRVVPLFLIGAFRSRRQALASEGCLAADVRTIGARVFWTRTLWRDAGAMREFMRSGAHRSVMPKLVDWCDEASLVDWEHDALPEWSEAEARMRSHGRLSRVRHPSPAQARGETLPAD
jgi:hypothetical protein